MAKCIILSRVSTARQELDSQTQAIKNEAFREGFKENDFIIIEDVESAIKLSEEERNGLNRMKEEIAKDSTITHVFIYELSRLSRRQLVLFSIRDYLIERKIQLVCCTPYFRLLEDGKLSQTANLMFSIFASMAESEMSLKQERMKRGRERNKQSGKLSCGVPLFGYKKLEDKTLVVDEDNKQFVIDMFNMYSTGMHSLVEVAEELCAKYGDVHDNVYIMTAKINYMLKNKKYCGDSQYPQIISHELFEKCRQAAAGNTHSNKRHPKDESLLKRLIYDKMSGYHMTYSHNCGYPKYSLKSGYHVVQHMSVRAKCIDEPVWKLAVELHKAYIIDNENIRKNLEKKIEDIVLKIMNLQANNITIGNKIDKIEERLIFGKISQEKAEKLEDNLKHDKWKNEEAIAQLREERSNIEKLLESDVKMPDYESFSHDEKVDIIRQIIKRVEIYKEERYKPIADVYTNVDNFRYTIYMDSWNDKNYLKTQMIINQ